jgi:predicted amidohydrolase YtcJ
VNDEVFSIEGMRPCITHCNFMSAQAIDTMARLGIVADLQPIWLYQDGKTLRDHFGDERTTWFQPYRTLFGKGVTVGGGSDHMQKLGSLRSVNPYNPWLGIWTTLTRQPRWTDEVLHSEQRITREEALRLYTINNARLMFEEQNKGSLEAGKLADLIVIDRDYLDCPIDEIQHIQVEQTWLGGREVHQASGMP